jgi:glycosyltransferase involved in cell wall biosynthesis
MRYTPVRFSQGLRSHLSGELFDRAVARHLDRRIDEFVGFNGQALRSFRRAETLGCQRFGLVAATLHVNLVARQHARALAYCPDVEPGWLHPAELRKTLLEYHRAQSIYVGSDYSRQSFIAEGIAPDRLVRLHYPLDPRFVPARDAPGEGFRVVYTGSLTVTKGIPVLLDAFARFDRRDAELTLVGGSSTRGMRRYLDRRLREDRRVRIAPGDPLPHLQRAHAYVHPSFHDGYGYAPMEALACAVPVIVTDQTGMQEHVNEGVDGFVVPAGDPEAITDRLDRIASGKIFTKRW